MFRLSATFGKLSAFGLSGAVHAAVFLTPLGHPAVGARQGQAELATVDVQLESEPAPLPAAPQAPLENHAPAYPTHTHPYPVPASHDFTPHDPSLVHVMAHEAPAPLAPAPAADTKDVVTAEGDLPRFSMAISAGLPGAGGVAHGSPDLGVAPVPHDDDDAGKVLAEGNVDTPARVVRRVTPSYPVTARSEGVEAPVALELVVSASGSVEDVRVERAAGHGLDEAAARAVRQFVFSPAIKRGHPVRVRMSWVVDFRLD